MSKEVNAIADELRLAYEAVDKAEEKAFRALCRLNDWNQDDWRELFWETWSPSQHDFEDEKEFRASFAKFVEEAVLLCEYEALKARFAHNGTQFPKEL